MSASRPPLQRASPHLIVTGLADPCLRLLLCGYGKLAPGGWSFSRSHEPFWRLYWNDAPGASIRCGTTTVELCPASMVLISPHAACTTQNDAHPHHLFLHFHAFALHPSSTKEITLLPMAQPLSGMVKALIHLIKQPNHGTWELSLAARALISHALCAARPDTAPSPQFDPRILKVLAYLEEQAHTRVSNSELARLVGMNANTLGQLFRQQIGHPIQTHLRIKRVEKAGLMLQFSDASIEQIAEATGFCDRYHFSRVFASVQKMTPAAYRLAGVAHSSTAQRR